MHSVSTKLRTLLMCICILGALSGCIKNKIKVVVEQDGTGHILVSRIFQKEMVDMFTKQMDSLAMQMPSANIPEDPFYNEDQMRMEAGQYGPGVKFLKAKKYDRAGAKGYVALYEFEDVNDIFINVDNTQGMQSMGTAMGSSMADGKGEIVVAEQSENAISFELKEGSPGKLLVNVPDYPAESIEIEESEKDAPQKAAFEDAEGQMAMQQMKAMGNPYHITGDETQGEILKKMMKGFAMSISLEMNADKQDSDASHVRTTSKGQKGYALLDMNMDKMLMDDKCLQIMCSDDMENMGGMTPGGTGLGFFSAMNGLPGMTVQTNDFVVTFE